MNTGYRILAHYERAPYSSLTINKLAKVLGKSYGWAHKECKQLIDEGVLNAQEVGPSLVCTVNFSSNKAIGLLALASIERAEAYFVEHRDAAAKLQNVANHIKHHADIVLYTAKGDIVIVGPAHHRTHVVEGKDVIYVDKTDFDPQQHTDDHIILGFEVFWRMTGGRQ